VTSGVASEWCLDGGSAGNDNMARSRPPLWRQLASASGAVVLVIVLAPPFAAWARSYEWVEALQFCSLVILVPALAVSGAPWGYLGLAQRRHLEAARSFAVLALELCVIVAWRTPAAVDWLSAHDWSDFVEAAVVLPVGIAFWLECVESPPLVPRSPRVLRIPLVAIAMWTVWILAYLVGLSHADWYNTYRHTAGRGISLAADQQITAGVLWFVSACAFCPVVFWNLVMWLHSEEDPDEELHRLTARERRQGELGWTEGSLFRPPR